MSMLVACFIVYNDFFKNFKNLKNTRKLLGDKEKETTFTEGKCYCLT